MTPQQLLQQTVPLFIRSLSGRNVSQYTATAYKTDVSQFLAWVLANDGTVLSPAHLTRSHITDFLSSLADQGRTGVTRARKLAAMREYCKFLTEQGVIPSSPATTIKMPKKEKKQKTYLRPDEYSKMLAAAGGNPRDFCILQLFLQTGIRVSELIAIELSDLDLAERILTVHGKGKKERNIVLVKKAMQAVQSYLCVRPKTGDQHVFLNYEGAGLSVRGVRKIVDKYVKLAGIQKKISCHGLRHTFGTTKAVLGMNAFQLKELFGHSSIQTSVEYVHIGTLDLRKAMEQTSL